MLQIAKKKIDGQTVGFIVGWPVRYWKYSYGPERTTGFRRLRASTTFKTIEAAKKYRDRIESKCKDVRSGPTYEIVE